MFSSSHQLAVADLRQSWHWDHHNGGQGYTAGKCFQGAPGLSSQPLDPFFPFKPYAASPMNCRSIDACVRSVLSSGAFRVLNT